MNVPTVFQCLMRQVLLGLTPEEGPDHVSVHIDDVIIFLLTLEDHMSSKAVLDWLGEAGFKLKPTKCYFVREEVEYRDTKSLQKTFQVNPKIVVGGLGTILPATSCGLCHAVVLKKRIMQSQNKKLWQLFGE